MNSSAAPARDEHSSPQFYESLFDAIPQAIVVLDADLTIKDLNYAASRLPEDVLFGTIRSGQRPAKVGELLHCLDSSECGNAAACKNCGIVVSVANAFLGKIGRHVLPVSVRTPDQIKSFEFLLTAAPVSFHGETSVLLTFENKADWRFGDQELR